ncbi:DUF6268 family outer membrane beta-barrel protein [Abyssalbus ytuae]|uniref:DUF6268 family outer membrane beta-barrel protein n=1 Tax=Abyssalbus ytuae TaxID=2926907 RepID=A0A9E7CUB9_9FLAO|nr:DUF6268 family outer membrane beta-barrel protein [Abyssalbus ytuae]UOB18132.1 DUF6268 family outer membrane beta-barrel protein [Abyssalbus ytuae]
MKYFILFTLLLKGILSFAQERDLATVNYSFSNINYNDSVATLKYLHFRLNTPLWKNEKNRIFAGINYKSGYFNNFNLFPESTLHGVGLRLGWNHKIDSIQNIILFFQSGIYSDFQDISGKDFRSLIGFSYTKRKSDSFKYGIGAGYSRQFFGHQVVPFFNLEWKVSPRLAIYGQLPVKQQIEYSFSSFLIGSKIDGNAASYRLSEKHMNQFVKINEWNYSIYAEKSIYKNLLLNAGIGYNLIRSFKIYEDFEDSSWTIFTIPLSSRDQPIEKVNDRSIFFDISLKLTL